MFLLQTCFGGFFHNGSPHSLEHKSVPLATLSDDGMGGEVRGGRGGSFLRGVRTREVGEGGGVSIIV